MSKLFSIGEFANLHNISTQTLIYYDKIGLLSPIYRDENTGYRYYGATQLELLDSIFILKEIGVPLEKIKNFLSQRTTNKTFQMLKEQKANLDKQINHLSRVRNRLKGRLDTLKSSIDITEYTDIEYLKMGKKIIYYEDVAPPHTLLEINISTKTLLQNLTSKNIEYNYQIGTSTPLHSLLKREYDKITKVFSFLEKKIKSKNCLVLKEGIYAIIYHLGGYHNENDTYERLIKKIEKDGYVMVGDSYEECIIDNLVVLNEYDYLTKISIPVKKYKLL